MAGSQLSQLKAALHTSSLSSNSAHRSKKKNGNNSRKNGIDEESRKAKLEVSDCDVNPLLGVVLDSWLRLLTIQLFFQSYPVQLCTTSVCLLLSSLWLLSLEHSTELEQVRCQDYENQASGRQCKTTQRFNRSSWTVQAVWHRKCKQSVFIASRGEGWYLEIRRCIAANCVSDVPQKKP